MTEGMRTIYDTCAKVYSVPDTVQGVSGASTQSASAAAAVAGLAVALLCQTA